MQEKTFSKLNPHNKFCPVVFYILGGFLLIMPRYKELTLEEWNNFNYLNFIGTNNLPIENKIDSFGWLKNKIIAIDYGS